MVSYREFSASIEHQFSSLFTDLKKSRWITVGWITVTVYSNSRSNGGSRVRSR